MVIPDPSKVRRQPETEAVDPELSDAMKARMTARYRCDAGIDMMLCRSQRPNRTH
jgi:hypothetical protein